MLTAKNIIPLSLFNELFMAVFTTIIAGFILSRILRPLSEWITDWFKNDKGFFGKIYNKYLFNIGRVTLPAKKKHPKLKSKAFEYKIYNKNGNLVCYLSKINRLNQMYNKGIYGEINRKIAPNSILKTYFKGYLVNSDNFLVLEEKFKHKHKYKYIASYYKLNDNNCDDIVGITVEEKDENIINGISIISFKDNEYSTVLDLMSCVNIEKYLQKLNLENISLEGSINNRII